MSLRDEAFVKAMAELESRNLDKAAWARAFADSEGSEEKARSLYVQYRANSLIGAKLRWDKEQKRLRREEEARVAEQKLARDNLHRERERAERQKREQVRKETEEQKLKEQQQKEDERHAGVFTMALCVGALALLVHISVLSIWLLPVSLLMAFCWGATTYYIFGLGSNHSEEGLLFAGGAVLLELLLVWLF